MDANRLNRLFERQLEEDSKRPVGEDVAPRTTDGTLQASHEMGAGALREEYNEETWIWPDLYLEHAGTISVLGRPFDDPADVCRRLCGPWRRTVRPDDTMLCVGDLVFSGRWESVASMWRPHPVGTRSSWSAATRLGLQE